MSAHATLAGGALDVDVLVHALDVADGGVDARRDGFDLLRDGVQSAVHGGETLPCPVLVVPAGDVGQVAAQTGRLCVRGTAPLLPGVVLQVMHVLLVFIHEGRCVV